MVRNHLKRIRIPKTWNLKKKVHTFTAKPNPGAHSMDTSITMLVVLRDLLGYADTKREAVRIMNDQEVLINHKRKKDIKFAVGIMDTISFPAIDEYYRVMINSKGKLFLNKTTAELIQIRPVKIQGKATLKGGQMQLSFTDGTTMRVKDGAYLVGDTLLLEHPGKVKEHLKIESGNYVYFTKGKQVGNSGIIENLSKDKIIIQEKDGTRQETSKKYAFVIGKKTPSILLPEIEK